MQKYDVAAQLHYLIADVFARLKDDLDDFSEFGDCVDAERVNILGQGFVVIFKVVIIDEAVLYTVPIILILHFVYVNEVISSFHFLLFFHDVFIV